MERKCLKKEIKKLLGDYVGIKLRENEFDPQGKRQPTILDELNSCPNAWNWCDSMLLTQNVLQKIKAHYDLAINIALPWLSNSEAQMPWEKEKMKLLFYHRHTYPNRIEREAMILSSYAGMLMNSIPVEDVIRIYNAGPSATHWHNSAKGHWIHPCNLSLHPFAMLTAPQAAEHARKQSIKFHRAATNRNVIRTSRKGMDTKRKQTEPSLVRK